VTRAGVAGAAGCGRGRAPTPASRESAQRWWQRGRARRGGMYGRFSRDGSRGLYCPMLSAVKPGSLPTPSGSFTILLYLVAIRNRLREYLPPDDTDLCAPRAVKDLARKEAAGFARRVSGRSARHAQEESIDPHGCGWRRRPGKFIASGKGPCPACRVVCEAQCCWRSTLPSPGVHRVLMAIKARS
jgi:hypothetical protein